MVEAEIPVRAAWLDESRDERARFDGLRKALRAWWHKPLGVAGSLVLACMLTLAFGAPVLQRYDPHESFSVPNPNYNPNSTDYIHSNARDAMLLNSKDQPSGTHWLGTDDGGHDTWARVVWGTRRSLGIGVASLSIAVVVGAVLGIVSGYYSGTLDTAMQRVLDAFQAFPPLLLLILAATAFELSIRNLIIALAVVGIPQISRLVRGTALSLREMPFVEAGRVIGATDMRIMIRHVLPNSAATLIVVFTIGIGTVIVAEAALAFLALTPPGISWGYMLFEGVSFISVSPWQAVFAGAAITLAVLSFNLVGDALRDILDPRLRI